jgi:hypothetical protein
MLKRKWIINNRGFLVGIWNDCRERDAAVVHFPQEPVLATAPAARSNDRAAGGRRGTARHKRVPGSVLLPVLSSLFVAALVWADIGGRITGTVTDQTGAVIPGATAVLVNTATGVSQTATTNDGGAYTFPVVSVGEYEIDVTVAGFKPYRRTRLVIDINSALVVAARLRHYVDQAAAVIAVFSVGVARQDSELRDGVEVRDDTGLLATSTVPFSNSCVTPTLTQRASFRQRARRSNKTSLAVRSAAPSRRTSSSSSPITRGSAPRKASKPESSVCLRWPTGRATFLIPPTR